MRLLSLSLLALLPLCLPTLAEEAGDTIPGVGPAGPVVKLHTKFAFTEGPAADRKGNVYFSDVPYHIPIIYLLS